MEESVTVKEVSAELKAKVFAEGEASIFKLFKVSETDSEPFICVSVFISKNLSGFVSYSFDDLVSELFSCTKKKT